VTVAGRLKRGSGAGGGGGERERVHPPPAALSIAAVLKRLNWGLRLVVPPVKPGGLTRFISLIFVPAIFSPASFFQQMVAALRWPLLIDSNWVCDQPRLDAS